jgi:glyoxylase-like metal-dependent hydrolase (beta-lactamase superfamily II)
MDQLKKHSLRATDILLTHGHFDHIAGLARLKAATDATIWVHEADALMLMNDVKNLSVLMGMRCEHVPTDKLLKGGETLNLNGISIKVLHTPGHSPGGVSYLVDEAHVVFTGDTLFKVSVGRTDFMGSNESDLYQSILEKLFVLPDDYTAYPGHMDETTIGFEKKYNSFVQYWKAH